MAAVPTRLERLFGPIAALSLFGMMALTFISVVARYFFDRPIAGVEEVQGFFLGLIVFAALPLVTRRQRHIAVRALASQLKGRILHWQRVTVLAATTLGLGFMGYLILLQANTLQEEGIITNYLEVPEAPFTYFFALLTLLAAAAALLCLWDLLAGKDEAAAETVVGPE